MYLLMNCLKICDKETATSNQSFFKKMMRQKTVKDRDRISPILMQSLLKSVVMESETDAHPAR